jgi:dTDP-4-dehydrorhamnose reductase
MKILIIGSSGILGHCLYSELRKKHEVYHTGLKKRLNDLTIKKNLEKIFNKEIDVVINCCAITNIEFAERNKKITNDINFKLVKNILILNKTKKFFFINFSTDQVYNIKNIKKNTENNISFNSNYYTKTKIKSDKLINKFKFLSLRVNFFGKSFRGSGTFTDWLFLKIKNKDKFFLFEDQFISGLTINTLSKIITKILDKRVFGLYNLGSTGYISKKNLALKFYKNLNIKKSINFESVKVNNFLNTKRSNFMYMNCNKFVNKFHIKLPNINKEIKKASNEYK